MFEGNQYKKFRIEGDNIFWKNQIFPVTTIKHLFFQRVLTTRKVNFVAVGDSFSAHLGITMDDGERIALSVDDTGIFVGWNLDKTEDFRNLAALHAHLSKVTYQKRIATHVKLVAEKGYFEYGGWRFFPKDKVVCGDKEFPLDQFNILRGTGFIEIQKKSFGFFDQVKRRTGIFGPPQISALTDTDVLFALLQHYFGLQWS